MESTYFNPRSHEGSDEKSACFGTICGYFNPRSHEGSDMFGNFFRKDNSVFQSTLPRGERLAAIAGISTPVIFQSTLPRGERRYLCQQDSYLIYFNPRSHEGSDQSTSSCKQVYRISIHAPTRGATLLFLIHKLTITISIHAPTRGAT